LSAVANVLLGAASGIGKATVLNLVKRGCIVYAGDIAVMTELYKDYPQVHPVHADVTSDNTLNKAIELIQKNGHTLYGLVNSAGIAVTKATDMNKIHCAAELNIDTCVVQSTYYSWQHNLKASSYYRQVFPIININLVGTMRTTKAAFPMIAKNKGCIVNIASVAGRLAVPFMSTYCASKFGSFLTIQLCL